MWLAENSNMRMDKISMWMSIESRSPFQDHELVDLALSIPLSHKLPDGGKAVLKDAVRDLLPPDTLTRPKWGFNPPVSDWLRGPLRPLVEKYCSPERLQANGLNPAAIMPMIEAHMERRAYHLHEIWNLLILQLWWAVFTEDEPERWSAEELSQKREIYADTR
jgi:asparagine synthase (glutamine-hydrolysing)